MSDYIFEYVDGHIEVRNLSGEFLFSADTAEEAWREIRGEAA